MIEAETQPPQATFAARLARRASLIGKARAEMLRRRDPWRWRTPRLLWPLFTKRR